MKKKIFYIDPQSMNNLSEYDYSVTKEIDCEIIYLCSKYYDYKINPKLKYIMYLNTTTLRMYSGNH